MNAFDRSHYLYTPLFCEENICKLVATFYTNKQATPIDVIFIINPSNSVGVFEQRAATGQHPVIWDYHVVLSAVVEEKIVIFDFDSRCAFPTDIQSYFALTFPAQHLLADRYRPWLKCIAARQYLAFFSSDRSHMKGVIPDNEFPPYAIIQSTDTKQPLSLQACIDTGCETHGSKLFMPDEYAEQFLTP